MGIRYRNKTLFVLLCIIYGMQLISCATNTGTQNPNDKNSGSEPGISQQQEANLDIDKKNQVNAFEIQLDNTVEIAAIQGDIEFLNNNEAVFFDEAEFRKILQAEEKPSGIVLNFEGADIREVISLIIGKIMKQNYLIDPAVRGTVTLKTEKPLNKDTVFYMLESILDIYGARIVKRTGHYRIFPKSRDDMSILGFGTIDDRVKLGYGYRIIPLEYVSSEEMVKILESVTNKDTIIRADDARNLIIIGGTSESVRNMLNAINMFDVDWMKGTNVGLIKIHYSNVNDVLDDLKKMLASNQADSEPGGILTLDSIERLNTILVITKQYSYLKRVKEWISKLDIPVQGAGSRLYVYQVKNLTAKELAATLRELFVTDDIDSVSAEDDITGPGSSAIPLGEFISLAGSGTKDAEQDTGVRTNDAAPETDSTLKIIAAEDTNSLLISATPIQFAKIESALGMLDSPPLQVLMEVAILDVKLTENLAYGMQWFLEHGDANSGGSGVIGGALSFAQTFSYSAVRSGGDITYVLGLLAADGKVDVLSTPSIQVRNNRKATIRVGDQQPISTSALNTDGTLLATSVEYKDTGIILEIQPSITSSGTINVDITQEVIDVGEIDAATGQRTFLNRNLNTSVSVNNGETIILGGLIRSNKAVTKSGVPGLRNLPGVGFLFGQNVTSEVRTELLMILSPRIIRNSNESNDVMKEYRAKFNHLSPFEF